MKVKDLIVSLKKLDQEKDILFSIDSEGNGFHEISHILLNNPKDETTDYGAGKLCYILCPK